VSIRRLATLQWIGFLVGGTIWWVEYVAGVATAIAACNPAGRRWGIPSDAVQLGLMAFGLSCVIAAQIAAVVVFRATRTVEEEDPPPEGRLHFFAAASLFGNTVFLVIILLSAIATVVDRACHQ